MEYITLILLVFFTGLLLMIRNFLAELPNRLHDIKMETIKNENAKQLQIDSFYRQTSNDKLMETLSSWIQVIYDIKEFSNKKPEDFIGMLSNVVLHGSEKSLCRMADFQQYTYRLSTSDFEDYNSEEQGLIGMYLASFVVAQLKEDFTGYTINPEELLRSKISDYNSKKDILEKCKKEAERISEKS